MLKMFKRLLEFAGTEKRKLILSFVFHICHSFFEMLPIMAILTVLTGILSSTGGSAMPHRVIWVSFGIMMLSVIGKIIFINVYSPTN